MSVEGPDLSVVVDGNGGDQKVREAETLSGRPRSLKPVVDARPRLLRWKERIRSKPIDVLKDVYCRQNAAQPKEFW